MYLYLWTLNKVISHALEQLNSLGDSSFDEVFDDKTALDRLIKLYESFLADTRGRLDAQLKKHAFLLNHMNETAAQDSLHAAQVETLESLHRNEIISMKLYILLRQELTESGS